MFDDAFIKLDIHECKTVLADINPVLTGSNFNPDTVTILAQPLSFYSGYRLFDIVDYEVSPPFHKVVIYKAGDVIVLDGTNKPFYDLNNKAPLKLNKETVTTYVKMFFSYIRGSHGKFAVVENIDDINWREEPPPAARKALGKILYPVTLNGGNNDGSFHLTACLMFKSALYKASIFITGDGKIDMSDEEILIDNMAVLDDVFGQ